MRNWILIFSLLINFIFSPSQAQDFIVGLKYGIGNSYYSRQSDDVKTDKYNFHKGVLVLEFSPFMSKFFICSGVEYKTNDLGTFVSVPLTFRIAFQKKIRPFLEGGGYYNYILDETDDLYTLTNDLGVKIGGGLLIHLGKRWRIDAGYFHRFGFTPGIEEEIMLPLGQVQIEEYLLNEGSIELSAKYRF